MQCRAWPSPCKVQPPEVMAKSWHHFLASSSHSQQPGAQRHKQERSSSHQVPDSAPARVGTCCLSTLSTIVSRNFIGMSGVSHSRILGHILAVSVFTPSLCGVSACRSAGCGAWQCISMIDGMTYHEHCITRIIMQSQQPMACRGVLGVPGWFTRLADGALRACSCL